MVDYDGDRLYQRVIPDIDYTIHDEAVSLLLSIIECPITRDNSDDNGGFNNKCCDKEA